MIDSIRQLLTFPALKGKLIAITTCLLAFHVIILLPIICYASSYPTLLGLSFLAYGLGLRHAVDPDHIAAIDNVTRKLMQEGEKPAAVGFFFALGHSTIVIIMCTLVALSASFISMTPTFKEVGGLISSFVSCAFLVIIGLVNLLVLIDTYKTWRKVVSGESFTEKTLADHLNNGGLLAKLLRPALKIVGSSLGMYWVGLLFGLGFDTASEVALLSISGSTGASGMPIAMLLLIPLSFAAGMTLIDSADGVLMLGAYGWAFLKPVRKLYYNMTITATAVAIALLIGGIEILQIIGQHTNSTGWVCKLANGIQLENWGFYIIGIFILMWIGSILLYKWRRYDDRFSN